jgi:uncharacterized membrane protein YdjX (TVP38/TMEM64 family)
MIWGESLDGYFTIDWIKGMGVWAWAAGIGLMVADLILPMPGTVVMAALGFVYGMVAGGLIALTGLTLATSIGYGIGRSLGEKFVRRWLGDRDYENGKKFFSKGGGWAVAISRSLPILPEVVSCMAGISRMPFGRFSLAAFCGNLPMAFLFAAIGASGNDAPWWAIAASLLVPAVFWLVASRIQKTKRD